MAGGYRAGPIDGLDPLLREFAAIKRRLAELERPGGTSIASLYDQVQDALANINATVQTAISANSYTKGQIDNLIANPPSGVAVTGNFSATGTASAGGLATFNAGISSTDVRSRVLTNNYAVQYVDGSGRQGTVPSARRFKRDITPHAIDPNAIRSVQIVTFRYKAAVDELGDDAPVCVGVIADQIDEIEALRPFVQHDETGEISGVDYGQMVVPLIATVQDLLRRVDELEAA